MPSEPLRFRDIRRTSAFRLTTILGLAFAASLLILLGAVYLLTSRELIARSDRILHAEANRLLALPPAQLPEGIKTEIAVANGFTFIELLSSSGEHIVGNMRVATPIERGPAFERETADGAIRLLAVETKTRETIVIGRDIGQVLSLRRRILIILGSSGLSILAGLAVAATLLALAPLRRVRLLEQAAEQIASGRLDVRMPIAGRHDELDRFALTVNIMVQELERVIAQVKGVTDAIAHDLRTPLSHVRLTLGRIVAQTDAMSDLSALAVRAVADLDTVLARFTALLRISEIEARQRLSAVAEVCLPTLIYAVRDLYEPLADARQIALFVSVAAPITIEADEKLLFESISNLVDNAIKFARSSVILSVAAHGKMARIEIRDDGSGIPECERGAVLRRFHRGTNATAIPGSGLGLSVVAAIAHLHGQTLHMIDAKPGLLVRLEAPLRAR